MNSRVLRHSIALLLCTVLAGPACAQINVKPSAGIIIFGQAPDGSIKALQTDSSGNAAISGSITASLSGFTPNGAVANLSVTTSSGNVALPTGAVVAVLNSGANDASIKLSVGAGSAATTDFVLKSGATVGLTVGSNTYINAITASGSTTLSLAGGAGLVSGYGGGGSGGGSGGAVTVADGADVTLGAKADAKSTATDTTAVTVMQVLKEISAMVQAPPSQASTTIDGGNVTLGAKADAKSTATDTTAVTVMQVLKEISAMVQAPPAQAIKDSGGGDATDTTNHAVKVVGIGATQGAAISGQTLSPVACQPLTANPTAYSTATVNIPSCDEYGGQLTRPYSLSAGLVQGTTSAMTGTTSTSLVAAPGANLHNYITTLSCVNSHATVGTFVTVQDGSGGTALLTVAAAAVFGGTVITFPAPLRQPTANTALYVADVTTGANVICSASGYKAP